MMEKDSINTLSKIVSVLLIFEIFLMWPFFFHTIFSNHLDYNDKYSKTNALSDFFTMPNKITNSNNNSYDSLIIRFLYMILKKRVRNYISMES